MLLLLFFLAIQSTFFLFSHRVGFIFLPCALSHLPCVDSLYPWLPLQPRRSSVQLGLFSGVSSFIGARPFGVFHFSRSLVCRSSARDRSAFFRSWVRIRSAFFRSWARICSAFFLSRSLVCLSSARDRSAFFRSWVRIRSAFFLPFPRLSFFQSAEPRLVLYRRSDECGLLRACERLFMVVVLTSVVLPLTVRSWLVLPPWTSSCAAAASDFDFIISISTFCFLQVHLSPDLLRGRRF